MNPMNSFRYNAAFFSERSLIGAPSRMYSPLSYSSRMPRMFSSVDFPDPDEPMIDTSSPAPTSRLTSFKTCSWCEPVS